MADLTKGFGQAVETTGRMAALARLEALGTGVLLTTRAILDAGVTGGVVTMGAGPAAILADGFFAEFAVMARIFRDVIAAGVTRQVVVTLVE